MRPRLIVALLIAAGALAGCAPYGGPVADCFSFAAGESGCDFRPLAGAEEPGGGA